ncbi:hypothetical protein [Dickeya zeae]|uniref:hypothetical protein n=1 Tax=Dickeya zeae TaxID=204042 RepID=UPI00036EF131|nr:hypothetical protein [Dickeya zeae]UJR55725.1 hypothetical protein J417_17805 [Dickeya zeae MS1]
MRKIAYYLPNLHLNDDIDLGQFRLLNASKWDNSDSLIEPKVFGDINGTLIEVDGFSTGDLFSPDVNESIYRELELIKFSYFLSSVSNHLSFVSNDAFEVFRIIEKNKDPSFEHKIRLNNGVDSFWMPLDKYYKSKALSGGFGRALLTKDDLKHYYLIKSLSLSDDDFMMISIFNKTRNLYTDGDFVDRVLFARIVIEKLARKLGWKLTNITDKFLDNAFNFIESNKIENEEIERFFSENVMAKRELIKNNIENYLNNLREARHALAHAGEQSNDFQNICYFMAWFPVAFMVSFEQKETEQELALQTIFLLAASGADIQKWQEREYTLTSAKRTILESFEHISRVMPVLVSMGDCENIEAHLKGLKNAIVKE